MIGTQMSQILYWMKMRAMIPVWTEKQLILYYYNDFGAGVDDWSCYSLIYKQFCDICNANFQLVNEIHCEFMAQSQLID